MSTKVEKPNPNILTVLADAGRDRTERHSLLRSLIVNDDKATIAIVDQLIAYIERNPEQAKSVYQKKAQQLNELLAQMMAGPMREATFLKQVQIGKGPAQAFVALDDGARAYTAQPDDTMALRCGDRVVLEGKGSAILAKSPDDFKAGETAQYERRLGLENIEVSLRDQKMVFLASSQLREQMDAGEVKPGATLVVNSKTLFASYALPPAETLSHFRYLTQLSPPNVIVEKHIGDPPKFIDELTNVVRCEMTQPCLRRRYRLRSCVMKLLSGVSGSGKTLAIHGFWRRMYEVMSEVTGAPLDALPHRVFTLRMSQVLSMWFGESDKNVDRFFEEVEELAEEPFRYQGKEYRLPVLAILEEVDGVARARGQDSIYDRVLTTILQRLDSTREELQKKLIIFIGTTNEPGSVDRAFLRRVGGTVEHFGRLGQKGFEVILQKHIADLPLADKQAAIIASLSNWLFRNGQPLLTLTYTTSTKPDPRYRRDLLTGSIIDRAVQAASNEAAEAERLKEATGVTLEMLMRSFEEQFVTAASQITEYTAGHHLDLPDGMRVATVKRS